MSRSWIDSLQVALKSRGIDKLLDEAREDNKENDARLNQLPSSSRSGHDPLHATVSNVVSSQSESWVWSMTRSMCQPVC